MSTCPTVKVKTDNEDGFMIINEADFDETKHEIFTDSAAEEAKAAEDAKAAENPKPGKPAWAAKKTAS